MAYPITPGSPSMSGNYIPEIWSGKTLVKFYNSTVFASISNTDYEGEIKDRGDKVIIRTVPDIAINEYVIDQELTYTKPEASTVELLIDKGFYYAFPVNDVEKKQADINYVEDWTKDAGQQLGIRTDKLILSDIYADADADNVGLTAGKESGSFNMGVTGTPREVTKVNILDVIVDMGTVLDEQDGIPDDNRSVVLPSAFVGLIKKSDLQDASFSGDARSSLKGNGKIGMISEFMVYKSNNLTKTTDGANTVFNCIACHKSALTFAAQLTKNEVVDNQKDFGKLQRGLEVFGYEVLKGTSLIHFYGYKG